MFDIKLCYARPRRIHSANFELTLARNAATLYKNDSGKLSDAQRKLVKAPLAGKITLVLFCIALVVIQLL